ncbi:MAG: hypothetical protein HZA12_03045 [Nitrospirae bacterium]|nr:hypothetical protein [Nitrospirota bacterium]
MKKDRFFYVAVLTVLLAVSLYACGGGGDSTTTTTTPTTTTATLSGTAAKGGAIASVTVAIKDKNGSTKTGTTGTDGKYTIDITGMTGPFLLKVSDGTTTYYSVSTATGTATANIHQFTDLIIRNWYKVKGADIDTVFSSSGALSQVPTASEIDTIAAVVVNIISSWLSTVGLDASTFNMITSAFNADGTGFDKVLDNNTVTIDASGNVTVTSTDATTGTPSTIATTSITTDLTGGTHASGTYTWNSTTGVITMNSTSSNFVCEGPSLGTDTITGVTIAATTMTWADKGDRDSPTTWTRTSGTATAGSIVGTWTATGGTGNSWTLTFNVDLTFSVVGNIVSCGSITSSAQVANNSGGRIDHVNVGNVSFSENLSYNTSLYTTDNGSYCGDGCSTGFLDVPDGTNNVVVYQTATSTPVSVGSLGSFVAGNHYAVNIRNVSNSYCAELWQKLDTTTHFNDDTTRVLISTTCQGASQFDGTYTGSWTDTCPLCGITNATGTFTITVANGVLLNYQETITSGGFGIKFDSGTVSSSGAIMGTGATPSQCSSSPSTFTGQITITSTGGAGMTMTYSRTASPEGCGAESGTMTATRM